MIEISRKILLVQKRDVVVGLEITRIFFFLLVEGMLRSGMVRLASKRTRQERATSTKAKGLCVPGSSQASHAEVRCRDSSWLCVSRCSDASLVVCLVLMPTCPLQAPARTPM